MHGTGPLRYSCACPSGIRLENDNKTCKQGEHWLGSKIVNQSDFVGTVWNLSIKDTLGPANLFTVERLSTLQR